MFQNTQNWKTSNRIVSSYHSPLAEIFIKIQNTEIIASPFKTIGSKDVETRTTQLKDFKSLQQQNNFTNQILETISSQLDRIETKFEPPRPSQITIPQILNKIFDKNKSFFKPADVGNDTLNLSKPNDELIKILTAKLSRSN